MIKVKVGLDVDGVLANFYLAMARIHSRPIKMISDWELEWINDSFHTIENDFKFWEELPILTHPEEITFDFDYYITAVPEQQKASREKWLKTNGFPDKPVIVSDEKLTTMRELGVEVLIDDKFSTVKEVDEAGFLAIHFIPSYLETTNVLGTNIKHLSQVNKFIDEYVKEKGRKIKLNVE